MEKNDVERNPEKTIQREYESENIIKLETKKEEIPYYRRIPPEKYLCCEGER